MTTQPETPQIFALLAKVAGDLAPVGKEGRNAQQNYSFRAIDDFMNAAHPALVKHGVSIVPEVLERHETERTNAKGSVSLHVVLRMAFHFVAPDGSAVRAVTEGEAADFSDKATNKAMSAAFKYALMQTFCIPLKDMAEGDKDSPELGKATPPPSVDRETGEIRTISTGQQKRLFAIGKSHGWTPEGMRAFLSRSGFTKSAEVTVDAYDDICSALEEGPTAKREPGSDDEPAAMTSEIF